MNIEQGLRIENENLKRLLEETERERDEALAQNERLRGALNMQMAISGGVESGDSVYDRSMAALNEQPPAALVAFKAELQAAALERLVNEFTHKWEDRYTDIAIGIMRSGRGYIYPAAVLEFAKEIRQCTPEAGDE